MIVLLGILGMLSFLYIYVKKLKQYHLPKGPRGIPIVGNIFQIGFQPQLKLAEWALEYGKLYTVNLAHIPALVVNDTQTIKNLFALLPASGRFRVEFMTKIVWNGSYGIGAAEGEEWQEQKQFCLKSLKQFGLGQAKIIEPIILEEVDQFSQWIESEQKRNGNNVVVVQHILKKAAGNALWTMITGERMHLEKSKISHLFADWMQLLQVITTSCLIFFPWLRHLAPEMTGYQEYDRVCGEITDYVENCFQKHKKSRMIGEPARDIIDAYIDQVENCEDPKSTFYGDGGLKHAFASVVFLMIAGADSTGTMLNFLIFYLSAHPNIQMELQEEIDKIIGKDRDPSLLDKPKMPFLEAVILETFRFGTLSAFGGFHRVIEDMDFQGYRLPKGMLILANLYFVHRDKTIWGDPENFRPQRFLEAGGEKLKDFIVVFSPGRRTCPGRLIANDIMFIFVAKLFQKFNFCGDKTIGDIEQYMEPQKGFLLYPKIIGVKVSRRV